MLIRGNTGVASTSFRPCRLLLHDDTSHEGLSGQEKVASALSRTLLGFYLRLLVDSMMPSLPRNSRKPGLGTGYSGGLSKRRRSVENGC
jgi:chloramphenicol 3-O-phosphotransferase